MPKAPKLSIVTISYNQQKFIEQALQSFVDQQVDFDIEIIVADDASTDGTQDVIRQYGHNYPDLFTPILRKKNVGAWNNFVDALRTAKGKYIALCEGDDYWSDPTKLQRQVNFMDANEEYTICFHPVRVTFENGEYSDSIFPSDAKGFTVERLLQGNFIQTNSVIYRRQDYANLASNVMPGDWYIHLYHAQFGKIGFINRVMSVYRRHAGGLWWDSVNNNDGLWSKYGLKHFSLYNEILKMYGDKSEYEYALNSSIAYICNRTADYDIRNKTKITAEAIRQYPDLYDIYVKEQYNSTIQYEDLLKKRLADNTELYADLSKIVDEYEHQIATILTSKSYRVGYIATHPREAPRIIKNKTIKKRTN